MDLAQPSPKLEIDMLVHDCIEYALNLKDKLPGTLWQSGAIPDLNNWEPSEDELMHVLRLRKLKDLLMRLNGLDPLKWAINKMG